MSPEKRRQADEVFDHERAEGRLVDAEIGFPVGWHVFVARKNGEWRRVVALSPRTSWIPLRKWNGYLSIDGVPPMAEARPTRGHEMWTVAPMGFWHSVAHQQATWIDY